MDEETKFRQSFDSLLREIISKRATMSPELKSVVDMLVDHNVRLREYEKKVDDLNSEMNQKLNSMSKQIQVLINEIRKK